MSGGIAYIYDVKGNFSTLCNHEMVDLDPLDENDLDLLKDMLSRHFANTGSTVAGFVLNDIVHQAANFVKVFPKDYKKALSKKLAETTTVRK